MRLLSVGRGSGVLQQGFGEDSRLPRLGFGAVLVGGFAVAIADARGRLEWVFEVAPAWSADSGTRAGFAGPPWLRALALCVTISARPPCGLFADKPSCKAARCALHRPRPIPLAGCLCNSSCRGNRRRLQKPSMEAPPRACEEAVGARPRLMSPRGPCRRSCASTRLHHRRRRDKAPCKTIWSDRLAIATPC